jgi:hypothetical protein
VQVVAAEQVAQFPKQGLQLPFSENVLFGQLSRHPELYRSIPFLQAVHLDTVSAQERQESAQGTHVKLGVANVPRGHFE